ncbi:MAG: hypothetical protein ACLR0N_12610 [Bilophila wadsworthia]
MTLQAAYLPGYPMDVPDEQAARLSSCASRQLRADLVRLSCHAGRAEMLDKATSPRMFRICCYSLRRSGRHGLSEAGGTAFLAWTSVKTTVRIEPRCRAEPQTKNSLKRSDETVELRLKEAWCWLLVPGMDRADMKTLDWERIRLSGSDGGIIMRAATKLLQEEMVISKWAPALLRMELDDLLWRGTAKLQVKQLWEYLCTYCYLPRLADYGVLQEAIERGLPFDEYFAYAAGGSNAEENTSLI